MPVTPISVEVSVKKGEATYKSESPQVQTDGTITINQGERALIAFSPSEGQTWAFVGVTVDPLNGDIGIVSVTPAAVMLADNNPSDTRPTSYTYTLFTDQGPLDPRLINKGN